jgi:hypothetical protein
MNGLLAANFQRLAIGAQSPEAHLPTNQGEASFVRILKTPGTARDSLHNYVHSTSYSKLVERYVVSFATFFTLNVPDALLRKAFSEKNNFKPLPPPLPPPSARPLLEITIGPPRVPIAEYLSATRIEYVPDKFLLDVGGPMEEVAEVVKRLHPLFSDLGYDLNEMVRYVEINFPPQPVDVKEAVRRIRSLTTFKGGERLSELVGGDVGVFSFSLSSPETPLTLRWFHLTVDPDVNSPNARVLVRIVKRAERMSEGIDFLTKIPQILIAIKRLLEGSL